MSLGISAFRSCRRNPITSTSGILRPSASAVFDARISDSMVIDSMPETRCCFVFAEIGIFAANRPFGNVAFAAGMAVEFGSPRVEAETEPQEAIVIAGLLSCERTLIATVVKEITATCHGWSVCEWSACRSHDGTASIYRAFSIESGLWVGGCWKPCDERTPFPCRDAFEW